MLHKYIFVYLTFKLKITIMEKLIQEPVPRPIAPIECACGCGHEFQPRRRDQKYRLDSNFAANPLILLVYSRS